MTSRKALHSTVACLQDGGVKKLVDARMREFAATGRSSPARIFSELCFCILTANFTAGRAMAIQREVGGGFLTLPEGRLAARLRSLGYRFPNTRARYIVEARRFKDSLKKTLAIFGSDEDGMREWLVENVKGLGFKEASHFMRNIGFKNQAIIDFHIVDVLVKYGFIRRPKTLSKKSYLAIEKTLRNFARRLGMTPAELDLYLWYCETGEILK
jgi:N-glycosylase/DNA lyase